MLYYRRKILLALLELFDGQLTAKSLQKYLFLFTRKQTKRAFDFIPYKYGCFSFQANQDINTMKKYGYLEITEQLGGRFIKLKQSESYLRMLKEEDQKLLLGVKRMFGSLSQQELITYTYKRYPYYAINSSIARDLLSADEIKNVLKQKESKNTPMLFTIGYEGISLEEYLNRLIKNDVRVLCDVRKNAYSQKSGFSKSQLSIACKGVGIEYIHIPELGIESDKRRELNHQHDYDFLFEDYENYTLPKNQDSLLKVRNIINNDKRVALTCFEKDPGQCHRTRVADALMKLPDKNYGFMSL